MVGDQTKVQGIATSSSTAGSLTSLSIALGRPAVAPFPIEKVAEKEPIVKKAPPDHPIYALVGQVASGFAHLEHILDLIIWDLTGGDVQSVACVTAQINGPRSRYVAIEALLNRRNLVGLAAEVEKLKQQTYNASDKRNRIVHDPWYVTDDQAKLTKQFKSTPTKDGKFGICDVDLKELEALIKTADELANKAEGLRLNIRAKLNVKN
jgi:hypothetical protein